MTREEQIELMKECEQDAEKICTGILNYDMRIATKKLAMKLFFQYRATWKDFENEKT